MGRSSSVRRLSDKLHSCIARGFLSHLHTLRVALCISAIKRLDPIKPWNFETSSLVMHLTIHSTELPPTERFHSLRSALCQDLVESGFCSPLGLRGFPPLLPLPFPNGYLPGLLRSPPLSDLILHQRDGGQAGKGKKGRGETKRLDFSRTPLTLSGSGNPEYAIHRVVEPEIDHIES